MYDSKHRKVNPKVDTYLREKIWPDLNEKLKDLNSKLKEGGILASQWYLIGSFATDKAIAKSDLDLAIVIHDREQLSKFWKLPIWGESTSYGSIGSHRIEMTAFKDDETIRFTEISKPIKWNDETQGFDLGERLEKILPRNLEAESGGSPEMKG